MSELTELEEAMRSLKKDNLEKKRLVAELEDEKKYIEERNRYLIEKLKQAGVLYEESGKRLMDFVNENVKPLKAKLSEFEAMAQKTKEYEKSIAVALKRITEFEAIIGDFKNEVIKGDEKEAGLSGELGEMKKALAEMAKRIARVQTFGSEELGEKVEEIKAKFGEDTRKIEDEFSVLKLGVGSAIDNFKKEFERQANALRNEMEKVDIKKAKELGDALAQVAEELNKTKTDFSKSMVMLEKSVEKLDMKKTKEMDTTLTTLSSSLDERFGNLAADVEKRVEQAESELKGFRVDLEKTLGKTKLEARDFMDVKAKEFDSLLQELKAKMNEQLKVSSEQWSKNLGTLRTDLIVTKKEVEKLIATINRKVELGEERREKKLEAGFAHMNASVAKRLDDETEQIYGQLGDITGSIEDLKANLDKKVMDTEKEMARFKVELEKTLGKAKVDTRDFVASKAKEFDAVLAGMKAKVDDQVAASASVWDKNLGALRSDLVSTQEEVEKLIGSINRKVELGEERREKKLDAATLAIQTSLSKKIDAAADEIYAKVDDIDGNVDAFKEGTTKTIDSLRKAIDLGEVKRKEDIDKIIKNFMVVKGEVDEKIREVSAGLDKFSKTSEVLRRQITKESLAGVQERVKAIIAELEKKFEVVEDGIIDKIATLESDVDELNAGFQGIANSVKTETERKLDFLRKEFEKRDIARDKGVDSFAKTLQKTVDAKFDSLITKMDARLKETEDETNSVRKDVDSFTVDLSEKFDSIISSKSKNFEKMMEALVTQTKAIQKDVNLTINDFKKEVERSDIHKKAEIERFLKEFVVERGRIEEKIKQVDAKLSEFSAMRKELKKEIYNESLAGVNQRVKDIIEGIEERFGNSRNEMENRVSELMKSVDMRVRETEASLNGIKAEMGRTTGKLRDDVDKITGKKAGEVDRVAAKLRTDVDVRVKATTSELYESMDAVKNDIVMLKGGLEKQVASLRKEIELGEAKRSDKVEKTKAAADREVKVRLDEFSARTEARIRASEAELKALRAELAGVVEKLRDRFDEIIEEKSETFETTMDGVVQKSEKAKKDAEALVENLKAKFQVRREGKMEGDRQVTQRAHVCQGRDGEKAQGNRR